MKQICRLMLLLCIPLFLLSSCSDDKIEKILDGTWHGKSVITDDDGDQLTLKMTMILDRETHKFNFKINLNYPEIGRIAVMKFKGEWSANESDLMLDIDEKSISVKFDDEISLLANLMGIDADFFERQMTQELRDQISGFGLLPIKNISDYELTIDFDDSNAFFKKERNSEEVVEVNEAVADTDSTAAVETAYAASPSEGSLLEFCYDQEYIQNNNNRSVNAIKYGSDQAYLNTSGEWGSTSTPLIAKGYISNHEVTVNCYITEDGELHGRFHNTNGTNLDFNGYLDSAGNLIVQLGHGSEKSNWHLHFVENGSETPGGMRYEGTWGGNNNESALTFTIDGD